MLFVNAWLCCNDNRIGINIWNKLGHKQRFEKMNAFFKKKPLTILYLLTLFSLVCPWSLSDEKTSFFFFFFEGRKKKKKIAMMKSTWFPWICARRPFCINEVRRVKKASKFGQWGSKKNRSGIGLRSVGEGPRWLDGHQYQSLWATPEILDRNRRRRGGEKGHSFSTTLTPTGRLVWAKLLR